MPVLATLQFGTVNVLADGAFHFLLGLSHGRTALVRYSLAYALGRISKLHDLLIRPTRRVCVISPGGYPMQLDGDNRAQVPVEIAVAEGRLSVLSAEARR